jgi:hypothetical protein
LLEVWKVPSSVFAPKIGYIYLYLLSIIKVIHKGDTLIALNKWISFYTPYKIYGTPPPPQILQSITPPESAQKNLKGIKRFYLWFSWLRISSGMWCWQVTGILQKKCSASFFRVKE